MAEQLRTETQLETEHQPSPEYLDLIQAAFAGDLAAVETALSIGAPVGRLDPDTGLSPLHIACGQNDMALCRLLIEKYKAPFGADRFGRWPSVVAAVCRASDELCDYIVEAEAAFLTKKPNLQ